MKTFGWNDVGMEEIDEMMGGKGDGMMKSFGWNDAQLVEIDEMMREWHEMMLKPSIHYGSLIIPFRAKGIGWTS